MKRVKALMRFEEARKKGAAAVTVVIFFTILLGIIVASFASIMITNIDRSTDYDLSQSAYDAALAGMEDAKVMLLKYNNCVARNDKTSAICGRLTRLLSNDELAEDCNLVGKALGRIDIDSDGLVETPIQTRTENVGNMAASMEMAYTCVKVNSVLPEYRGELNKEQSYRMIPLRSTRNYREEPSPIHKIRLSWYTTSDNKSNGDDDSRIAYNSIDATGINGKKYGNSAINHLYPGSGSDSKIMPPPLVLTLSQTPAYNSAGHIDGSFKIFDFGGSYGTATNHGTIVLRPNVVSGASTNIIRNSESGVATGFAGSAAAGNPARPYNEGRSWHNGQFRFWVEDPIAGDKYLRGDTNSYYSRLQPQNSPYDVACEKKDGESSYWCSAEIELPDAYYSTITNFDDLPFDAIVRREATKALDGTRYLGIYTPYDNLDVTFQVELFDDANNKINFVNVQSRIDSTGRANDLFRRIESRVELVDTNFPFPRNALTVYCDGDGCDADEGMLKKRQWVSKNCFGVQAGKEVKCGTPVLPGGTQDFTEATPGF